MASSSVMAGAGSATGRQTCVNRARGTGSVGIVAQSLRLPVPAPTVTFAAHVRPAREAAR